MHYLSHHVSLVTTYTAGGTGAAGNHGNMLHSHCERDDSRQYAIRIELSVTPRKNTPEKTCMSSLATADFTEHEVNKPYPTSDQCSDKTHYHG